MAPSPRSSRPHAERGLARLLAQRSPLVGRDSATPSASPAAVSATPSPGKSIPAGVTLPPHGTAALVGIVVMLCVIVFGFSGWRVWAWRRNKRAASSDFSEKSNKPGLFSPVDYVSGAKCSVSPMCSVAKVTFPEAARTHDGFPGTFKVNLNYQPKVIYADIQHKPQDGVLPPGIAVTPAPPSLKINPPPDYADITPSPLSPRSASKVQGVRPPSMSTKLPRLVIVESTFTATLHDELEIHEGETLRLLEEYEDEWCLVQRVGRPEAEKGVVPQFCLVDKPNVAPLRKSKHIPRLSTLSKI